MTDLASDEGRSRRRGMPMLAVAVLVLAMLVAAAIGAWRWQRDRAYIGTTTSVNLNWSCGNAIFWSGTSAHGTWWAGHNPAPTGTIDTRPPGSGDPPQRHAEGRLHFTSYKAAVFTSKAGGTMVMTRQPRHAFYTADCAFGFRAPAG